MKRALNVASIGVLIILAIWAFSLAIDAWWVPSVPVFAKDVGSIQEQAVEVVHRQWTKPGSIGNEQDLADYAQLILTAEQIEKRTVDSAQQNNRELQSTRSRLQQNDSEMTYLYRNCEPVLGRHIASAIARVLFHPRIAALENRFRRLLEQEEILRTPSRLIIELQYACATARILRGENIEAVTLLVNVIERDPTYSALENRTYMIAGRADALSRAEFCVKFEAIGGDLERLRRDYVDRPVMLSPVLLFGSKYHRNHYENR